MAKTANERQAGRRAKVLAMSPLERTRDVAITKRVFSKPPGVVYTPEERAKVDAIQSHIRQAAVIAASLNIDLVTRYTRVGMVSEDTDATDEAERFLETLAQNHRVTMTNF
jgi:hypothetical protein